MASRIHVVLRPVKSIVVRFCPFESNVESTRKFLECINRKKIQATNRNCEVTADVRHDGSEPLVDVMFADYLPSEEFAALAVGRCDWNVDAMHGIALYGSDGERLIMKGANLTTVEMLTALGSRCNAKELKAEQKSKKNP